MIDGVELDGLRTLMRSVTADIIQLVKTRMDIAQKIGDIKNRLDIQIEDEAVEQEIQNHVQELGGQIGLDRNFIGRFLNLLLTESVRIQVDQISKQPDKLNHMTMFMRAKKLESEGKKIIHLEVGEPDYFPPHSVKDGLLKAYEKGQLRYTETQGIASLRMEISKQFHNIEKDQVIVTPGARFAVFSAIVAAVMSGEEVLILEPAWPAYRECVEFVGAKTKVIKTSLEQGWDPELEQIKNLISKNTKMLILNYPNNPTGKIIKQEILDKIIGVAQENGIFVLSDEVYAGYSYCRFKSILDYAYDKSIMVSSFSKSYAMTGFRIGYAIASKNMIDKMTQIQAIAITSVAEPIQYAALSALRNRPTNNAQRMRKRLEFMNRRLREMPLEFCPPDGGMYFFVRFSGSTQETIDLIESLLEKGVAVAPGIGFGKGYGNFLRISACQPIGILEKGLDIIESVVRNR
jgi:aspartate aminotransferase